MENIEICQEFLGKVTEETVADLAEWIDSYYMRGEPWAEAKLSWIPPGNADLILKMRSGEINHHLCVFVSVNGHSPPNGHSNNGNGNGQYRLAFARFI